MNFRQIIPAIGLCSLNFWAYAQRIDTTFYPNKSILLIQSSDPRTKTIIDFYDEKGKSIINKNTFDYSFFDSNFNMKRVIKVNDRRMLEDYWISNSDTIYNEFNFDSGFDKDVAEFMKFISNNIIYPQEALKKSIQGKVFVSFVVNKKGEITQQKTLTSYGYGLEEEALRVVTSKKEFGVVNYKSRPVCVFLRLPVRFKMKG